MLPDKSEFFENHHVSEEDFERSGYTWDELMEIYEDYSSQIKDLKILAHFIEECMGDVKKVHSIKKRIKDPNHLIRKIIRKKVDKGENISLANYKEMITDLIGIRVLHLFKEDWLSIHDDITAKWIMKEPPVANVRDGDRMEFINQFKNKGLEIIKHQYGYRSVHYQILLLHNKREITAEIQVRTLFEEAWSEIDHRMRYPYNLNDTILAEYLVIFNRLAGSADEMGSFIRKLKKDLDDKKAELHEREILARRVLNDLEMANLSSQDKVRLAESIKELGHIQGNSADGTKSHDKETLSMAGDDIGSSRSPKGVIDKDMDDLIELEKDMGIHK